MVCAAVLVSNVAFFAESDLAGAKIRVEQGKILDFSAEPGYYTFDIGAVASLRSAWDRFKFGGSPGKDTRVYYFNLKELVGNKYGTPNPVPFRVVDSNIGLDIDISIRCFGEYSYHISNPILFYTNVTGNVAEDYKREDLDSQLKSELMTALQPAFAKISAMGIRRGYAQNAAMGPIQVNSAPNVLSQGPPMVGAVLAVTPTKESSVPNAVSPNLLEHPSLSVINAAGSLRIP